MGISGGGGGGGGGEEGGGKGGRVGEEERGNKEGSVGKQSGKTDRKKIRLRRFVELKNIAIVNRKSKSVDIW